MIRPLLDLRKLKIPPLLRPLSLLLLLSLLTWQELDAQCTFTGGPYATISEDYDTNQGPYNTSVSGFSLGLASYVNLSTDVTVNVCFWGDMDAANETFDMLISGQAFSTGGYSVTPSSANPICRTFTVPQATAQADIAADGDIDISYDNFGAGWTADPLISANDEFNAQITSVSFDYDINVTISNESNQCKDGADIDFTGAPVAATQAGDMVTFKIFPSTPGFNASTGTIDVSAANAGDYNVVYEYVVNGCTFSASRMVTVYAPPVANLQDADLGCADVGDIINLQTMYDGANSGGGTFSIVSGPAATITDADFVVPAAGGCFTIRYQVDNPNGCPNAPYRDEAALYVGIEPTPVVSITGATSPACSDGGTVSVNIANTGSNINSVLTINGAAASFGANNLDAPAVVGSNQYEICITETVAAPGACASLTPDDCVTEACETFTVFNDGIACGANAPFASECEPDLNDIDVCTIQTKNSLDLNCSIISINGPQLIEAEVSPNTGVAQCNASEICFDWQGSLPGSLGDAVTGGPTIADLNTATMVVCAVITFEFCIPLPFVDDLCIDPLPLGSFEDACDQTIGQFVLSTLGSALGGDGGGGIIVADTDGDGAFDYIVDKYQFPDNGTDCVPNNLDGEGVITVRNVTSWPFKPASTCGVAVSQSINLLELLPIGAIPIVGVIIEDVLAAASCNVDLVFSDQETVQIPVINREPPSFVNCNPDAYVFSEDLVCDTEVDWSIPVVYDGCGGDVLAYRGRTAGTDATFFAGPAAGVVTPTQSGVYQTAGPIPGSDLPVGSYSVTYTAYSCSGVESTCTFDVVVNSGDPVLACPNNLVFKTDVDECSTVVNGIAPLQGIGCSSVINYEVVYPASSGLANSVTTTAYNAANLGTHNDASGLVFPLGTSTITYTMMVDINGDGDVDDADETQTCEFTVEIVDTQEPVALCTDIEVQLDNTGAVTVNAEDLGTDVAFIDGGSTDNCDTDLDILIAKPSDAYAASLTYDCTEVGSNLVTLRVTDDAGNESTCIAHILVEDFFEGIQFDLDAPEICIEANNPSQLDFSNYLVITLPDATTIAHQDVAANTYLGDAAGAFGITAFAPAQGSTSVDPGTITADGVYTPGTGTGFVTVSYALALPGASIPQNGNIALAGCLEIVHTTFELRQPLEMEAPECECIVQNDRIVDLGEIEGGLEPYTIQFSGTHLDVDSDGVADDVDGEYTYEAGTHDITDFVQDLGNLLVDYTQPTWSFTVVDARGCELFRSGSCDNDDETGTPMIDCTALGAVTLYTRDEANCEVQDVWEHTLPTDNCDVILYTYTIENPDGTIAGPFDISALLNPDINTPLPDQFYGEYDFQHHSPTENVSTVTYYAEDAVGNFSQCSFTVTVIDDDPPAFINCPEPAVIVDAPATWCAAYANYSLPLAEDNCGSVTVSQIDDTGLTSGSLFPVGITINTYEAVDESGNAVTCDVKIIVNDYHTPPSLDCPSDVTSANDDGDCGAVVNNIAPSGIDDNCPENLTVVYRIQDEDGNEVASGFDDASGNYFDLGTNTVDYSVQDMPLLLITEVTHELSNTVDGTPSTTPSCFDGAQNGDETDIDCGGGVCTSCNCPENEVIVEIVLDDNPDQTTWAITEPNNGAVLASGGPYAAAAAGTTITESVCLPNDCYDFVIRDAGLDGICCTTGNGSYTLTTSAEVIASGAEFGTREVTNFCLDGAPAAGSLVGTAGSRDAIEITNFGSANLDVSCLMIERVYAAGSESYAVPNNAILAPGGVLTIHFGDGHDDPANNIFYVAGTTDLAINEPTAYIVSLSRSVLDVVAMNGFDVSTVLVPPAYDLGGLTVADYWSGNISPVYGGGIVRTTVWDTDTAEDFVPAEACIPVTMGVLNPGLAQPTPNGASTAIQAQPTSRLECSFTVTITDEEAAVCGLYSDWTNYPGADMTINAGECVEAVATVADVYDVADVNISINGNAGDLANLTFTLISPEGTAIELFSEICATADALDMTLDGDFGPAVDLSCGDLAAATLLMPVGDIEAFNGEAVNGDWTLQIGHNITTSNDAANISWSLDISARDPYDQADVELENDLGVCGADFTWFHPILFDNCPGGSLEMEVTFEDGTVELNQLLPIFPENTEITHFFQVGVTEVLYTLTDAAGNVSTCGFTVTVLDTEFPTLTCPDDLVIQLAPGECETTAYPQIPVTYDDNCPAFVLSSFPPGTPVPIGDTTITLIITDASGNASECTYNLTVLEHERTQEMSCISELNVSLGADCEALVIPEMVLTGDDHRCYDNYEVTLYPELPGPDVAPIVGSPTIPLEYVGQQIVYEVCDPETGDCCWGYINVEYKLIPEFICPADTVILCTSGFHPDDLGYPVVTSCVPGGAVISHEDVITDNEQCGEPRLHIRRTWTVSDGEGNSSTCVQNIEMAPFSLDQIQFPPNYDGIEEPVLSCEAVLANPSLIDPDNLGRPTLDGIQDIGPVGYCSAAMLYNDEQYEICENSFIIFRTWRVINLCLPNPNLAPAIYTQTIRVEDLDGPDIVCPQDQTISVSPFDCLASYEIPLLTSIDACSNVYYNVSVNGDSLTYVSNNYYLISGLEIGEHTIEYKAIDGCGRYSTCSFTLTVEDQIEPTAVCNDELNVSIGGGDIANNIYGEARVYAEDIDEGSSDNCSEVSIEVRRNYWRDNSCDPSENRWSPWGEYVDFYCCDINNEITIELRVTDAAGNTNVCWQVVTPEDKLRPICFAPENVTLSCSDLPLEFPGDIAAAYETDLEGTSAMMNQLFGEATGTDNCAVDNVVERPANVSINDCGWGSIQRRFEVWQNREDENGDGIFDRSESWVSNNSCAQIITITEVHDYTIDFPNDIEADCAVPCVETVVVETPGCDVLAVNVGEPVRFDATGDECYKMSITYDVINWCIWDGEYEGYTIPRMTEDDGEALAVDRAVEIAERPIVVGSTNNVVIYRGENGIADRTCGVLGDANLDEEDCGDDADICRGRWNYTQFIKVYDATPAVITVAPYGGPTEECPTLEEGQFGDIYGTCEANVTIPFTVTDECELFDGEGELVISIVSAELAAFAVDANEDGIIKANEFVTGTLSNVTASVTDNGDGTYVFSAAAPVIPNAMGEHVYHAVRVLLEDGCGNQTSEIMTFDVIDCKGPAPICINGLTLTLMPQQDGSCAAAIWASDFQASPIYDCTGQGPETHPVSGLSRVTKFAIYKQETVEGTPNFVPSADDTGLTVTAEDDPNLVVYVYAFDEDGNYDYCETYIELVEHENCTTGAQGILSGVVMTEENEAVENVAINLNGESAITTNSNGAYVVNNLLIGNDYTITPYFNEAPANGVSTLDIILISKHILGVQALDSPYKMIAADVNNTNTITTLDLIQIRKLILNITTEFTNNTSWRFVSADYDFPVASNPWNETFPEIFNINNLSSNEVNVDFVAIKTGDVNNSATANLASVEDNTVNETFHLYAQHTDLKAAQTYRIPVYAQQLDQVEGLQYTIDFDTDVLRFVALEDGLANESNFGMRYAADGLITSSWNWANNTVDVSKAKEALFTLVFEAKQDASLSNVLRIAQHFSRAKTVAEAYPLNGTTEDVQGVALVFDTDTFVDRHELYQNTPNPVDGQTHIGFYLPTAQQVQLEIRDIQGRLVYTVKQEGTAGFNSILLTRANLGQTTGVLSYTLLADGYTATRKMIVQ